jgi:hypothetical protein
VIEPVLGWRLWHLRSGHLQSWAIDHRWTHGENVATCRALDHPPCGSSPGPRCQCGFWATWSPAQCLARARATHEPPWHVMGLVAAWGAVAVHGDEGFRAERTVLRCLFVDRPWAVTPGGTVLRRLGIRWRSAHRPPAPPLGPGVALARQTELHAAGARYGVPLVSLRGAAGLGLLGELGVPREHVEAAARMAAGASAEL